ncbi:MAG: hypothetical protein WKF58_15855 [Ilumatobacteraceae bacterium]
MAADTMLARDVVNQIAYQYLVPTLQVGSKVVVDPESGAVIDTLRGGSTVSASSFQVACGA